MGAFFWLNGLANQFFLSETQHRGEAIKYATATFRGQLQQTIETWKPLRFNQEFRDIFLLNLTFWSAMTGYSSTLVPLVLSGEQFGNLGAQQMGAFFMTTATLNFVVNKPLANIGDI